MLSHFLSICLSDKTQNLGNLRAVHIAPSDNGQHIYSPSRCLQLERFFPADLDILPASRDFSLFSALATEMLRTIGIFHFINRYVLRQHFTIAIRDEASRGLNPAVKDPVFIGQNAVARSLNNLQPNQTQEKQ